MLRRLCIGVMRRTRTGVAVVASLAALLAVAVLAVPAAGAAGSVSTATPVANETTTHQFSVDPAGPGALKAATVEYGSGVGLDGASVGVGVDRDGDGDVDDRLSADGVDRGDRSLRVAVGANVTGSDRVVVTVSGVRNPERVGEHDATVAATVDGETDSSAVTYRVTPFRSDDTEFRGVEVPDSEFDRTYATDSTVTDARLVAADWRGVTLSDSVLEDIDGVDDTWNRVEFSTTTATGVDTERTTFDGVRFSASGLSAVDSTGDEWRDVSVRNSALVGVDSSATTYREVRFSDARVTEFSAESSTLDNVSVCPAEEAADDGNRSDASAGVQNGSASARFAADGPAPSDDAVDAVIDDLRGNADAPDGTVSNVTVRNATVRNAAFEDSALVDVRVESATLENVTFDNVTLRGVTLSGGTYAGTLSDEVITSEAELRQELLFEETTGAVTDGDVEVSAAADPSDGDVEADGGDEADSDSEDDLPGL